MKTLSILLSLLLLGYGTFAQQASKQLNRSRNYSELLRKSLLFFDGQACGPNVSTYSSFDWRGACHTTDGQDLGLDLTGGWHDAGDHPKFNYPMAQAVYNLASLYVDHRSAVDNSGNKDLLFKHLRFIGDYMIKCHPQPNSYVIQVAEGDVDHRFWQVPEQNTYQRRSFIADVNKPNTNLAGANAAAFAALSMAFRGVDTSYSAELLQHARDLYNFAHNYQVSYNANPELPDIEFRFYDDDNNFYDELMVGAAWLYRATGEARYRNEASAAFDRPELFVGGWAPGFGDHQYEATYQMIKASGGAKYQQAFERYVTGILNGTEGNRSPGGLWYVGGVNDGFNLPKSLGGAIMAYRYADLVGSSNANYQAAREFAFQQMNYTLGDNPLNRSYVVNFGSNSPQITHHRSASAGNYDAPQDPRTLTGALVMGPLGNDQYLNTRDEIKCTEPALGNNGILALIATLMVKETGGTAPPSTGNVTVRARGVTGSEQIEIRYQNQRVGSPITLSTSFQEYKVQVNNANGNFKVAFINDNGSRDAEIDWLQVGTTKRQAETRSTNTAVWQNGSCGGSNSQLMNCNGFIDFGTMSSVTSGQLVIRARSTCGSETMVLQVGGQDVQTWNNLSTSFANYTYDNYSGSQNVKVRFTNDGITSGGCDKNLIVDKITVCGTVLQAENVTRNGCGSEEWLYCSGNFDFGTVGCGSARVATGNTKSADEEIVSVASEWFSTYPNPTSAQLTVRGGEDYQVGLYDLSGRELMRHENLTGQVQLDVRHLRPGIYVVKVSDGIHPQLRNRVVIE